MKLQRWTTRPPGETTTETEARAGLLLRRAVVKQPLDASALAEVRRRLPDETRARPRRLVLRVGVAIALFLSGGGVVMSATMLGRWSPFRRAPAALPVAPVSAEPQHRRAAGPSPASPAEALAMPPPAPLAPVTKIAPPALTRRRVASADPVVAPPDVATPGAPPTVATPEAPAPPAVSAIAEEAALVGAALRKLREHDDAAGALALLDARDARFGAAGTLADEARTTRIEALLRLGQHGRALALLDAAAPRPSGRGRMLLATRGELRADAGRCREADADFDSLLADGAPSDDTAERALYGRAACRVRLGQGDAARADLEAYLARFPEGRYAQPARAALDR